MTAERWPEVAVPTGSFMPLEVAGTITEQFLRDPETAPPVVTWVSAQSDTLNWPDELR